MAQTGRAYPSHPILTRHLGHYAVSNNQSASGTVSPLTGFLTYTHQFVWPVSGVVSLSGALAATKTALLALAGTIGTITGSLLNQAGKGLAGSLVGAGALAKQSARALDGVVSVVGVSLQALGRFFYGTVGSNGTLTTNSVLHAALSGVISVITGSIGYTKKIISVIVLFLAPITSRVQAGLSKAMDVNMSIPKATKVDAVVSKATDVNAGLSKSGKVNDQ